ARTNDTGKHFCVASGSKRVRMRLAIDLHPAPVPLADVDVGRANLFVTLEKMLAERDGKRLDFFPEFFLGQHIDRVLDRVGWDDFSVVAFGVRRFEIALEHGSDV